MKPLHRWFLILATLTLLQAAGCTLKATTNEITDTTSNITGTTSGAAWWNEDGQIKPDFKATAFVSFNQENLLQDLAAGRGEYLASMSVLLGVPNEKQSAFFSAVQAQYAENQRAASSPTALLAVLQNAARPFLR